MYTFLTLFGAEHATRASRGAIFALYMHGTVGRYIGTRGPKKRWAELVGTRAAQNPKFQAPTL